MGIDLYRKGRIVNKAANRKPTTTNVYHNLLIKLYKFMARRTDSKFNQLVLRRLCQSNTTRYPVSLSKIVKFTNTEAKRNKVVVVVSSVLDDERLLEVPKLQIAALKMSESARRRVLKAGGRVLTLDQLAKEDPTGQNTLLLRGRRSREALKHFGGYPGVKKSHVKPYVINGNHKKERKYKHVRR